MARVKTIKQLTNQQFNNMFATEDDCKNYLVRRRWPEGVHCPRCGNVNVYPVTNRPFHWQCSQCAKAGGYRFSVFVGTIFENTNKPLRDWFKVIHLMLTSKKGMSALQIMRYMGFGSYKTALYMCHRIRAGLSEHESDKLAGIVEVDETYIGGKDKNKHWDKRSGGSWRHWLRQDRRCRRDQPQGQCCRPRHGAFDRDTLSNFVREAVSNKVSLLVTDDMAAYRKLDSEFPHAFVEHSEHEYVVGAVHTNTIEGFWSILKRGVVGTFHKVSAKYCRFTSPSSSSATTTG